MKKVDIKIGGVNNAPDKKELFKDICMYGIHLLTENNISVHSVEMSLGDNNISFIVDNMNEKKAMKVISKILN